MAVGGRFIATTQIGASFRLQLYQLRVALLNLVPRVPVAIALQLLPLGTGTENHLPLLIILCPQYSFRPMLYRTAGVVRCCTSTAVEVLVHVPTAT